MDPNNPNVHKLIQLVANDPHFRRRSGDDAALERFWSQYPKEKLDALTLEDYVLGKGSKPENFCWWLERGLEKALGRYMPGTARSHLLYRQIDGSIYKHRDLTDLSDKDALDYVLKLQKVLATAAPSASLAWLDDRTEVLRRAELEDRVFMGEGRRLRLLSMYNPDSILPIYSSEHIEHYLKALGFPREQIPPYNQIFARHNALYALYLQIRSEVPELTPFGFTQALYSDALDLRPEKQVQSKSDENDAEESTWTEPGWDSDTIHDELIAMGYLLTPGTSEPSYANEHYLGNNQYVYVKRKANGPVKKFPLVIHPASNACRAAINQINDVRVQWDSPIKSTSYRRFPRLAGQSQYGYATDVRSKSGLSTLIEQLKVAATESNYIAEPDIEMTTRPSSELNQILYGPPGTGKTYRTTALAVQIAEPEQYVHLLEREESPAALRQAVKALYDQLVAGRRIEFTTFHQSYAYEDFVEGIRAQADEESGALGYAVEDGIFKQLAILADADHLGASSQVSNLNMSGRRIWKMSLGNTLKDEDERYQDCIDNNYVGLGWGGDIDFSGCNDRSSVAKRIEEKTAEKPDNNSYNVTAVNTFKNVLQKRDIVVVSDGNHKFRAIAEVMGEYTFSNDEERHFHQMRPVRWLRVFETSLPREALFRKSLSQMTLYELKPRTIKLDQLQAYLSTGVGENPAPRNHVLIIDEINRGNIARIFGELITLLEPDKRKSGSDARSVLLPYSKTEFSVPSNLYVIGTMNTADKSLAQLDLALRRRFAFTEILPQPELLEGIVVHGVSMAALLRTINDRIEVLLDRDHLIGHSYFWSLKNENADKEVLLADIFANKLIPLLQEYFFADWERIRWVLNDVDKPKEQQFIQLLQDAGGLANLFSSKVAADLHDRRYRINKDALKDPAAYRGILSIETV